MQELIFDEMPKRNEKSKRIEVSVGLSRQWDARKAGMEVAKSCLNKLSTPPNFILLFSTIHYKYHGGFEKFLEGVWKVVPKGTPLIGGTVAGFINNEGCFSRGATALAVSYPNIDVSLGFGKHTKRTPKLAARNCANMIKNSLKNSNYQNKFLINFISGATVAKLPYVGRLNVINSKFFAWLATNIGTKIFPLIEYGWGREEDVVEQLALDMSDYYIIGGSTVDSGEFFDNYQFIGKKVVTNSIVAIGCNINVPIYLKSKLCVTETDKKFEITGKIHNGRVIRRLDNKSAKDQILSTFGIIEDQFRNLDSFYYRISDYFPFGFEENKKYTSGLAGFFGNNIFLGHKSRGKKLRLLSVTGKEILNSIDVLFKNSDENDLPFAFMSSSSIFLNILRAKTFHIKEKLDDYLKETPYLMIFDITENVGLPYEPAIARVYSFNVMSIKKDCMTQNL
jgi:hypothetical protein